MSDEILGYLKREQQLSQRLVRHLWRQWREAQPDLGIPMKVMGQNLGQYCLRGGKWHRPTLVRLAVQLMQVKLTPAMMRASVAVELMHRYLLCHDDLIDQDLKRHGGPTLEQVYRQRQVTLYGNRTESTYALGVAMVGGDLLNALTQLAVLESGLKPELAVAFLKGLNQELVETAAGWIMETELKQKPLLRVSLDQVRQTMLLVSAHYSFLWPLRLGQILGGVKEGEWLPALETYGRHIGLAFQITDDLLAIVGEEKTTGKPVGSDLREGKKTLLTQYAYQQANFRQKTYLQQSLNTFINNERLQNIREILTTTGAITYAKHEALKQAQLGIKAIESMSNGDDEAKRKLIWLGKFVAQRHY
ncbi:hypothetical protein A2W24_06120 [Microgenomates group bacterium RBG_16_45_19]|nr:MAG: hypothetical protein A2W24_06120 [Microgenomates group bacterium RBG_16_45_19]